MLDAKSIRENIDAVENRLNLRGTGISLSDFKKLDEERRKLIAEVEALKQKSNEVSKEIGRLKKEKHVPEGLPSNDSIGGLNLRNDKMGFSLPV